MSSGRGMDVVRTKIKSLGGTVQISSVFGQGRLLPLPFR